MDDINSGRGRAGANDGYGKGSGNGTGYSNDYSKGYIERRARKPLDMARLYQQAAIAMQNQALRSNVFANQQMYNGALSARQSGKSAAQEHYERMYAQHQMNQLSAAASRQNMVIYDDVANNSTVTKIGEQPKQGKTSWLKGWLR